MRSYRNLLMVALRSVITLAAIMLLTACNLPGSAPAVPPARSSTLAKGTLAATVNATGAIQPEAEVKLAFQATGKVAHVSVSKGDNVKKGDVLATLVTTDLDFALAQAQTGLIIANAGYSRTIDGPRTVEITAALASLNAAYASYNKLQTGPDAADISAAETAVRNAEVALRNAQAANDLAYKFAPKDYPNSPTQTQLELARNNLEAAKGQYDRLIKGADNAQLASALQAIAAAKAQVERLQQPVRQFNLDQANAEREKALIQIKQAQRRLDQARLVAPADSVVEAVNIVEGEDAGTGAIPAIVLVDNSQLHIDITVDEIDVSRIRPDLAVVVTLDALPGTELNGTVERIASTSTTVNGVISYVVRVVLAKTNAPLRVGMTANASIVLDKRENVLLAPNWAIRKDKPTGKAYLTVKADEKSTKEIDVKTGLRNDNFSEIISGATEGQVVFAPQATGLLGK
ncbi:MAG TPA: efflux RND transporter periplasmic adaptor subunit [Anaerolineae bacterium]|jgi:HlyD family secretion protein